MTKSYDYSQIGVTLDEVQDMAMGIAAAIEWGLDNPGRLPDWLHAGLTRAREIANLIEIDLTQENDT